MCVSDKESLEKKVEERRGDEDLLFLHI